MSVVSTASWHRYCYTSPVLDITQLIPSDSPVIKVDQENIPSGPGNSVTINCQVDIMHYVNHKSAHNAIITTVPQFDLGVDTFGYPLL